MARRITAIRMSGGQSHEHITHLWWADPGTGAVGSNSTSELVEYVERQQGKLYVEDGQRHRVDVGVVQPQYGAKYLRTYADGVWTNNLLALPRR
jgi:hypothetical protein